ncbi:MAG: hypothetical protein RIS29_2929 [Bacteroidota bacterium]|jgi:tetratricopeptide (TPR) repeat protein
MERKNYLIILLLLMVVSGIKASYKSQIYKAFISNDMHLWKKTVDEMNAQKVKSNDFRLELLNYQYGYIAWCIGNKKYDLAEVYIRQGEVEMAVLDKVGSYKAWVSAYQSAFYGYRIGLNKMKAPFIGPKSVDCAKLAMQQDADNPYGYIQYGNSQFYMPPVFGGSKKVALAHFLKAQKLMERNPQSLANDWNYLSLLTMIVKSYTALEEYNNAKLYCEKILKTEPDFLWVKKELYPEILHKIKQDL